MGDILAVLSLILALLVWYFLVEHKLSKVKTRIHMLDDVYTRKENAVAAIRVLEGTIKKLNSVYRDLERRIDILESGHPDSDFDLAETDDDGNVLVVWFNGKKYVPEDKRNEDTITLYADNKIVTETARPDVKCCATCKHYRPGPDHTCTIRPWLHVTSNGANMAESACHNYEKTERGCYSATKGQVDCPYIPYKAMGGNDKTEELLKRIAELNYFYNVGLMSTATYWHRYEEVMQNDS